MKKGHHKVYIIESLAPKDILDKRNEGSSLSQILTLGEIQNAYYCVVDVHTLNLAFDRIIDDINRPEMKLGSIDLHFSLHGSKDGISLTNGQFVKWVELYEILKRFNEAIGYMTPRWAPGKKFSAANLNFSSCEGFNAYVMNQYGDESPYTVVVGPISAVNWSDSLMAFATYYHHIIHKGTSWWETMIVMNLSAGLKEVFHLITAKDLYPEDRLPPHAQNGKVELFFRKS